MSSINARQLDTYVLEKQSSALVSSYRKPWNFFVVKGLMHVIQSRNTEEQIEIRASAILRAALSLARSHTLCMDSQG